MPTRTAVTPAKVAITVILLMTLPLFVYFLWFCLTYNGGRLTQPSYEMIKRFPLPTVTSLAIVTGWLVLQALLQVLAPGKWVEGSPLPDRTRLKYKMNGGFAWWFSLAVLAGGAALQLYSPALLVDEFGALLTTANILTFVFCIYLYWHGTHFATPLERPANNPIYNFWLGTALNPRIGNFDLKLFFEARPGLIAWVVLDFALAAKQFQLNGFISVPMILVCAFQFWYVADFFAHEEAILSTWDIRHENFGWMLCWGDVVWVPFTYTIQAQYLVQHAYHLPWWAAAGLVLLNTTGYAIFRGANIQKHAFRNNPNLLVWGKPAAYLRTSSGALLLTSGWWGLARHMNYFGDMLMALAWCLPCGFESPLPYFYFGYLTILLVHRERRDYDLCARRYGKDWDTYCAQVHYRIVPGIY